MHFLSSFWDIHNVYLKRSMLPEQNESVGTLILCHRWSKFCGGSDRGLFPGSNRYEGKSDNWNQQDLTLDASSRILHAYFFWGGAAAIKFTGL